MINIIQDLKNALDIKRTENKKDSEDSLQKRWIESKNTLVEYFKANYDSFADRIVHKMTNMEFETLESACKHGEVIHTTIVLSNNEYELFKDKDMYYFVPYSVFPVRTIVRALDEVFTTFEFIDIKLDKPYIYHSEGEWDYAMKSKDIHVNISFRLTESARKSLE